MIARISKLKHPSGVEIELPLLVPSFSSKGFRFLERTKSSKLRSEVEDLIKITSETLHDCALVSAFDLKYYIGSGENLVRKLNLLPEVLFIDSGGYETIEDYDLTEAYRYPIKSREWNSKMHEEVLSGFPNIPAVIVSYDNGQEKRISLERQIKRAQKLFDKFPLQLNDFLIKPSKKSHHFLDWAEVFDNISILRKFDILGVTEKELGPSMRERMSNIKSFRTALDKIGCKSPIHIFGNLDPLSSILYFLSGAEIFDGLTWLRYGFHHGMSLSKGNIDLFEGRVNEKDSLNTNMIMYQNIIYLRRLRQEMKSFVKMYEEAKGDEAYKNFQFIGSYVKEIMDTSK